MSKWLKIRQRRMGRYFVRNHKKDDGFQILIFGCMWINVVISEGFRNYKGRPHMSYSSNCEYVDDVAILWCITGTFGMIDA